MEDDYRRRMREGEKNRRRIRKEEEKDKVVLVQYKGPYRDQTYIQYVVYMYLICIINPLRLGPISDQ